MIPIIYTLIVVENCNENKWLQNSISFIEKSSIKSWQTEKDENWWLQNSTFPLWKINIIMIISIAFIIAHPSYNLRLRSLLRSDVSIKEDWWTKMNSPFKVRKKREFSINASGKFHNFHWKFPLPQLHYFLYIINKIMILCHVVLFVTFFKAKDVSKLIIKQVQCPP